MNLEKLFKIQAELDKRILDKHNLHGEDLLDKKILALQVELGELANEWRGFKFWSKDQEPRTEIVCHACNGNQFFVTGEEVEPGMPYYEPCLYCYGTGIEARPLLEEYVDCLHFILSIGLELGFEKVKPYLVHEKTALTMFGVIFKEISKFSVVSGREHKQFYYGEILSNFIGLGKTLGFTWEQIEQAYLEKNKINHERQVNGY
ncbi:dUTP diphosphatase [Ornithinibacillus sp. JPR2-1]|uniref:dUTP diphosphatase n=1 Tax=Ornithinibacillus sp. JPR2-1 TaxID=2094019 RepID=UPI0031E17AD1